MIWGKPDPRGITPELQAKIDQAALDSFQSAQAKIIDKWDGKSPLNYDIKIRLTIDHGGL